LDDNIDDGFLFIWHIEWQLIGLGTWQDSQLVIKVELQFHGGPSKNPKG
jgi:hypothetical protein